MSAIRACATLTVLAALPIAASAQDDDTFDRTPTDCIITSRINKTEIIDDQTILFYMRGRQIYRNQLPNRCPNLEREERFSYRTTSNRLCDIDTITVLEQWGTRLQNGFTCRLGSFHPVSQEEVEELLLIKEQGTSRNPVDAQAVELPAGADEQAEPAAEGQTEPSEPAEPERRRRSRRR